MSSLAGMEKVAMSRFEPDEFVNDRYNAMEQRLQVRSGSSSRHPRSLLLAPGCCLHPCICPS
jgi:hypothetical protein